MLWVCTDPEAGQMAGGDTGRALGKTGLSPQGQWDLPLQGFKQKSDRTELCCGERMGK